jgi:drug/metabolite transporter (DMT)-like permease
VGALLALASAVCYGLSDIAGGLLSRRAGYAAVALAGQLGGLVLVTAAALLVPASGPAGADLAWGALSGVGTGMAMTFLFRGLTDGGMSVVVPVSAVGGMALPVVTGVALLGDRPSPAAWAGIAVAVPALWLVSRAPSEPGTAHGAARGSADGLAAGAGVALQYLALAQADAGAGLWPVAAGRVSAALVIWPLAATAGASLRLPARTLPAASGAGGLAALALTCYLLAARQDLLSVAVVLSSLYPVLPVLLGVTVLRERLSRPQVAGLCGAAAAIGLLAAS